MTPIDCTNDQNIITIEKFELTLLLILYFHESCNCATLLKVAFLHRCFSRYLNWTNGTKSCRTSDILEA